MGRRWYILDGMLARSIGGSHRVHMAMSYGHACSLVSLTRAEDLAL